jgi:hypothetical protein
MNREDLQLHIQQVVDGSDHSHASNILGLNYLRMHGLKAEALSKAIADGDFTVERSRGKQKAYETTYAKGCAA